MEYQPGLPEKNDNISSEHPLKDFAYMLAGVLGIGVITYILLGFLVDFTVARISPQLESKWFKGSVLSETLISSITNKNTLSPYYFKNIDTLKQCANIDIPISFFLDKTDTVNAIAIPGGNIIVYQGLLNKLHSENGLAFVLAHELAHFKHRDHLRSMGRGIILISLATLITGNNSSLSSLVSSSTTLGQARFSQKQEAQADALALDILNCAYGHIGGASEFFESMLDQEALYSLGFNHYFASHPETQARISQLHTLAESKVYHQKETKPMQ